MVRKRKSKTEIVASEKHESSNDTFKVDLDIQRSNGKVTGLVRVDNSRGELISMYYSNFLRLQPDDIPELIEELKWAHRRWTEGLAGETQSAE